MVKTWSKEERGETACSQCGAVYRVTVHRFPVRDHDHFDCNVCGHRMNKWNSTEAPSYELTRKPESPTS